MTVLLTRSGLVCSALGIVLAVACGGDSAPSVTPGATATGDTPTARPQSPPASAAFTLTSEAFASGASIPKEYSCDGRGTSPALAWSGAPATTRAFALIVDDPDAPGGTFVHWVVYDLPATATGLPAAIPPNVALDNGAQQGVGGSRKEGYTGPCPPAGKDHHYSFRLYALDSPLKLSAGKNKGEVERAMDGHVLAVAELVGLYRR